METPNLGSTTMIGPVLVLVLCLLATFLSIYHFLPSILASFQTPNAQVYGTTALSSSFLLENAFRSFLSYPAVVASEASSYRSKFNTLRGAHRRLAVEIGYPAKIQRLERANAGNSAVTRAICRVARREFPDLEVDASLLLHKSAPTDINRVRESLKHLVRDWSTEGERERHQIFSPIFGELKKISSEDRSSYKVLIPGSGVGRLAFETASMGFDTTSCELSYYMSLSLRLLLSPEGTSTPGQHTVYPYAHWWSHQRDNGSTFRGVSIPDVLPRCMTNWMTVEDDFLSLTPPPPMNSPNTKPGYDVIVTLFFIDTATSLISYLSHIYYLLKDGGLWINLGPLLYSSATIELSLEEVIELATRIGFDVDRSSLKQIPSEYTADSRAMMKWIYEAQFWTARKRTELDVIVL